MLVYIMKIQGEDMIYSISPKSFNYRIPAYLLHFSLVHRMPINIPRDFTF